MNSRSNRYAFQRSEYNRFNKSKENRNLTRYRRHSEVLYGEKPESFTRPRIFTSTEIQTENQQINDNTILKLIKQICNESDVNEQNVADRFFRTLISDLMNITDHIPEHKSLVYRIISALVEVGLMCAPKDNETVKVGQQLQVIDEDLNIQNETIENNNDPLKDLQTLIDVDNRIQVLSNQRVDLYYNVYKNLLKTQRQEPNEQVAKFDNQILKKSLLVIKEEFTKTATNLKKLQTKIKKPNSMIETNVEDTISEQSMELSNTEVLTNSLSIIDNESIDNNKITDIDKLLTNSNTYDIPQPNSEFNCFCLYEDYLIAGYKNGTLSTYNLDTGTLLDNVRPHNKSVTSIITWNNFVITTSLDGTMKLFNMSNHTAKKIIVGQDIHSSFIYQDTLYLGTKIGFIYRLLIKDMKHLSNPFCVSKDPVIAIQVAKIIIDRKYLLMFTASAGGNSISVRDENTGSLLKMFKDFHGLNSMITLNGANPFRICAATNDKLLSIGLDKTIIDPIIIKSHTSTSMIYHKGLLFVASKENQIYIYDENTLNLIHTLININGIILAMVIRNNILIAATSKNGFINLNLPQDVTERWTT